ncbi:MAG: universal stress protein [Actinomycetota bacterium]
MYSRILVGTDGFGPAAAAVARAAGLAKVTGAELIVLHAYAPPDSVYGLPRPPQPGIDAAQGVLDDAAAKHADGISLRTELRQGEPAEELVAAAQEEGADLVMVGNVGMRSRFTLGSVPNQVSHHAPCDVWIVNTAEGPRPLSNRVVVGVDGSERALRALAAAARLAALHDAELAVVYVHWQDEDATSDEILQQACSTVESTGVRLSTRVEIGDPAEALIRTAETEGVDVLVVGNKGMTGVQRFLLGNVPNKISHHAPCDLLIVRTS